MSAKIFLINPEESRNILLGWHLELLKRDAVPVILIAEKNSESGVEILAELPKGKSVQHVIQLLERTLRVMKQGQRTVTKN